MGNRRYARGRAYVADRFSNPENAEAETLAAAEESLNAPAIDETVAEELPAVEAALDTVEEAAADAAEELAEEISEEAQELKE